jgi:hypothetical protein
VRIAASEKPGWRAIRRNPYEMSRSIVQRST